MKNTLLQLALIGVVGYVVYRVLKEQIDTATDKLNSVGSAIGSGLYDFFHPNAAGELLFYSVTFPALPIGDGQRHAIPSKSVSATGQFVLGSEFAPNKPIPTNMRRRWQIVKDKAGKQFAVPL